MGLGWLGGMRPRRGQAGALRREVLRDHLARHRAQDHPREGVVHRAALLLLAPVLGGVQGGNGATISHKTRPRGRGLRALGRERVTFAAMREKGLFTALRLARKRRR
jgi:hypothetical protein